MKLMNLKKLVFVTLFLVLSTAMGQAQSGNIQGTITDENGIYVPGANVYIESLVKGAISNFDGKFTLVGIPEGSYTLKITYMGYSDVEQEVNVSAGETTPVSIVLVSSNMELDEVQVSAYGLSGQSKALNTQRNNMNITNVVSTDQIGKFPDANICDAVKRIPGMTNVFCVVG